MVQRIKDPVLSLKQPKLLWPGLIPDLRTSSCHEFCQPPAAKHTHTQNPENNKQTKNTSWSSLVMQCFHYCGSGRCCGTCSIPGPGNFHTPQTCQKISKQTNTSLLEWLPMHFKIQTKSLPWLLQDNFCDRAVLISLTFLPWTLSCFPPPSCLEHPAMQSHWPAYHSTVPVRPPGSLFIEFTLVCSLGLVEASSSSGSLP